MTSRILIIEDDKNARSALQKLLEGPEVTALAAATGEEGLDLFRRERPDLVLTDVRLPGLDGLEVLKRVRAADPGVFVIVMTAYGTIGKAVQAMKDGAYDFVEKPLDARIRDLVAQALADQAKRGRRPAPVLDEGSSFEGIIGAAPQMRRVFETIVQVAASRATVLITGENGTGKELVAEAIHRKSPRAAGPLVKVNPAAYSPTLIESELFGHEEGAFTDARRQKKGPFELAHGGTLFLDEIGEIPAGVQVKLLRVLQEREFERVGGTSKVRVDIRLITATNQDLKAAVEQGRFREDLYFRINVVPIHLPPLRERQPDIPLLVSHFTARFARENGRTIAGVAPEALSLLERYHWPGNVRELENCIETAVVMSRGDRLSVELFPLDVQKTQAAEGGGEGGGQGGLRLPVGTPLHEVEKEMILRTLDYVGGNKTQAARILGISARTLYRKLEEYGR